MRYYKVYKIATKWDDAKGTWYCAEYYEMAPQFHCSLVKSLPRLVKSLARFAGAYNLKDASDIIVSSSTKDSLTVSSADDNVPLFYLAYINDKQYQPHRLMRVGDLD